MTKEKTKPIIQKRDRLLSASVFAREADFKGDGNMQTVYSVCLQRSYRKKGEDGWFRESINLSPDECLRTANLLVAIYNATVEYASVHKKQNTSPDYPAQSMDTPSADFDDDLPF